MGLRQSKDYLSESDLSDEPDIDSESEETGEIDHTADMDVVDAVVPLYTEDQQFNLDDVRKIEVNELDEQEIVGLLYLLYEERPHAFRIVNDYLLSKQNPGLLWKWANAQVIKGNANWQKKFIEAVSIVQNYKVLKKLGFNKSVLQSTYLPSRPETTCHINRLRKTLYLVAEKLTGSETAALISEMRDALIKARINLPECETSYLEAYFLLWEYYGIDFKILKNMLKHLQLEIAASEVEAALAAIEPFGLIPDNNMGVFNLRHLPSKIGRKTSTYRDNTSLQPRSFEDNLYGSYLVTPSQSEDNNATSIDSDRYYISPNQPGVVLIINQEFFHTEPNAMYRHLLHENNDDVQLEDRKGTNQDKDRLQRCFERMKFKVFVENNLAHYKMLDVIERITLSISTESSLIICILSHGEKGVVYGANSCKVDVSKIENIMCTQNKNLQGKPKVLILQSCQGKYCQKVEKDPNEMDGANGGNTTDGPSRGLTTTDLLTFWATIPGFAAIRNREKGSWFIQALCDEIDHSGTRYHFMDICTKALGRVSKQVWKESSGKHNVMVPMGVFTLTKSFYLPPFRD